MKHSVRTPAKPKAADKHAKQPFPQLSAKGTARLMAQSSFLEREFAEYRKSSGDKNALATLYRVNRCQRDYLEELELSASQIPPMGENCRLSVVLCCNREEANIENTLKVWTVEQKDKEGQSINPELFEIILLVNRPRDSEPWDDTIRMIKRFNESYPQYNIHALEHTFNFPSRETKTTIGDKEVKMDGYTRIGLVFKLGTDLVLLRNMQRGDEERKAQHLVASSGGDAYSRNPFFLQKVLERSDSVDFIKVEYGYPRAIAEAHPLLWAAHLFRLSMSADYHGDEFLLNHDIEREVLRRHGVFRAGLYADLGGFNPKLRIGEDLDFGRLVMLSNAEVSVMKDGAVDNPRRSLTTILEGRLLIDEYRDFGKSARAWLSLDDLFNGPGHELTALTCDNLSRHVSGHFQHYIKLFRKGRFKKSRMKQPLAFGEATELALNALMKLGIPEEEITFIYGTKPEECFIEVSPKGILGLEKARNAFLD